MKKVLVLIISYNASGLITQVLQRIPVSIWDSSKEYKCDVLILDDASKDNTVEEAIVWREENKRKVSILKNPINQGYGGNQKVGYTYAIENGYDGVVMLHGDAQYSPEQLPEIITKLFEDGVDAVFASRMIERQSALKGRMPFYKFIGNITLTKIQNFLLNSSLTEFHSGYRAYRTSVLRNIPFTFNSDQFDFDTDIIIQLLQNNGNIQEISTKTHYGSEKCHVNGVKYAFDILLNTLQAKVQPLGVFYHPKFDYTSKPDYSGKISFASSHSYAIDKVSPRSHVFDVGCGGGFIVNYLKTHKDCKLYGIDAKINREDYPEYEDAISMDLDHPDFKKFPLDKIDTVLLLDVIEHLNPEEFLSMLRKELSNRRCKFIITTPNVAFALTRLSLFFGYFNYGKKGILDFTHRRLFTYKSLKRLLEMSGFVAERYDGIPAPFILAFGDSKFGRLLISLNRFAIRLHRGLFSYQIGVVAYPKPFVNEILMDAIDFNSKAD